MHIGVGVQSSHQDQAAEFEQLKAQYLELKSDYHASQARLGIQVNEIKREHFEIQNQLSSDHAAMVAELRCEQVHCCVQLLICCLRCKSAV